MTWRPPPTKAIPPVPPNFACHFIEGGWRRVERVYGCRTSLMMTWIEMCGGLEALKSRRADYLRTRAKRFVLGRTLTAVGPGKREG